LQLLMAYADGKIFQEEATEINFGGSIFSFS